MSRFRKGVDAFDLITRHACGAHVQKSDLGKYVLASDYAALEAENARLAKINEASKLTEQRMIQMQAERDAALAQLAAIQQAKGEEVEVVASLQAERLLGNAGEYAIVIEKHSWLRECQRTGGSFDLMTVAQHQRITAAMAAEVERLNTQLRQMIDQTTPLVPVPGDPNWSRRIELDEVIAERDALRAELAAVKAEGAPLYSCKGKGGSYALLGQAKPAGAIKAIQGESGLIVYRDTDTGQLYFRDPQDFRQRMAPIGKIEPCSLGGDLISQEEVSLYALPPASPDVEGLVNELQHIAEKCSDPDTTDALDAALSTWCQLKE